MSRLIRNRYALPALSLSLALVLGLLLEITVTAPAGATNGMYLTSYGAESAGRAGANLAISDRTLAINFNPAGITQLQGNHLTANLALLAPSLDFGNMTNSMLDAEDQLFPLPAVAYVRADRDSPWAWGLAFVAQGGMGARFKDVNTFFGTRDETYSQVRFLTVAPTVAYAVSEDMSFGLALDIGYGDVAFRFFPETSFFNAQAPDFSFFGVRMEEAGGLQYNARLGWWWRPQPRWQIGVIYQTETESDFSGGDTIFNFTGHPFLQQKVGYTSDVEGFTFAAQAGIGVAVRCTEKWIVAFDVKRYFWDDAVDTITVTARNPSVPGAPSEVVLPFVFNWKDQWVYALGVDYRATERLTLRAGYNYGENPVPDETLNPLFPANVEHHLAVGFSWLTGKRTLDVALEHGFENQQTNPNPDPFVNPFGPGATVSHEQWTLTVGFSWAWARH